jgi:hypothetical protein
MKDMHRINSFDSQPHVLRGQSLQRRSQTTFKQRIIVITLGTILSVLNAGLAWSGDGSGLTSEWWYSTRGKGSVSQFLDNCSGSVRVEDGLWSQVCLGKTDSGDGWETFQAMAVFTVTGTESHWVQPKFGKYIKNGVESSSFMDWAGGCRGHYLKPGQSKVCVGEPIIAEPGDQIGVQVSLTPNLPVAAVGRAF